MPRDGEDTPFSIFGEVGPLKVDPAVDTEYSAYVSEGTAKFYGLEEQHSPSHLYTLEMCRDVVSLFMVDLAEHAELSHDPESVGQLIAGGPWSPDTKIVLDSSGTSLLAVQIPKVVGEGEEPAMLVRSLVAPNRERRDTIALTWRQLRQLRLKGAVVKDDLNVSFQVIDNIPRQHSPLASITSVFSKGTTFPLHELCYYIALYPQLMLPNFL